MIISDPIKKFVIMRSCGKIYIDASHRIKLPSDQWAFLEFGDDNMLEAVWKFIMSGDQNVYYGESIFHNTDVKWWRKYVCNRFYGES
ncbi:MAG: hypothetical protein ACI9AT_000421 [Ulvibacter sp.]|jgi:hypothetical protein